MWILGHIELKGNEIVVLHISNATLKYYTKGNLRQHKNPHHRNDEQQMARHTEPTKH